MKTVAEQLIEFVKSEDYPRLYQSVKDEWFETFIKKEKAQIIDAFECGSFISSAKDRLDYDELDYDYKDSETFYSHIKLKPNPELSIKHRTNK